MYNKVHAWGSCDRRRRHTRLFGPRPGRLAAKHRPAGCRIHGARAGLRHDPRGTRGRRLRSRPQSRREGVSRWRQDRRRSLDRLHRLLSLAWRVPRRGRPLPRGRGPLRGVACALGRPGELAVIGAVSAAAAAAIATPPRGYLGTQRAKRPALDRARHDDDPAAGSRPAGCASAGRRARVHIRPDDPAAGGDAITRDRPLPHGLVARRVGS